MLSLTDDGQLQNFKSIHVDATILKEQGNEAFRTGKNDEAIDKYTQAISIDHTNAVLYSNRAAAYYKLAQYIEAENDARQSIELDRLYIKGHRRLCQILEREKRIDAIEACTTALNVSFDSTTCKLFQKCIISRYNIEDRRIMTESQISTKILHILYVYACPIFPDDNNERHCDFYLPMNGNSFEKLYYKQEKKLLLNYSSPVHGPRSSKYYARHNGISFTFLCMEAMMQPWSSKIVVLSRNMFQSLVSSDNFTLTITKISRICCAHPKI
jgi:tetratricopeptide (TPR) repeat protein